MIMDTGSEKYIDKLNAIRDGHNSRIHPKTGFSPVSVTADGTKVSMIFRKSFPEIITETKQKKSPGRLSTKNLPFRKGDSVSVVRNFEKFRHGYLPAWNPEVYIVSSVYPWNDPPRYRLSSREDGEEIVGLWYAEELQKVTHQ